MEPAELNLFSVRPGAPVRFDLHLSDEAGAPVPLGGFAFKLQVRAAPGSPVLLEASTENGRIEVVDADAGHLRVHVPAEVTADLEGWSPPARYDLKATPGVGEPFFLLFGRVPFAASITT